MVLEGRSRQVRMDEFRGNQNTIAPLLTNCSTFSPENFLAYDDFDNTPDTGGRRKSWAPHVQHFVAGDPTWNGKGSGIIGAVNYLSQQGVNAFSFLTMNINGDDQNVFPYISSTKRDSPMGNRV
jgi:hypothetical protein